MGSGIFGILLQFNVAAQKSHTRRFPFLEIMLE